MAASGLHISISAEPIAHFGGLTFSNSMIACVLISVILIGLAVVANGQLTSTNRPKGLQNIFEWIIEMLYNLVAGVTNSVEKTKRFFPLVATFFLFILVNNWFGLIPGVGTIGIFKATTEGKEFIPYLRAGTADLNMTIALALISVIMTQVIGVTYQHLGYFKKYLNFSNPIMFFVGLLETISEVSKIISFAFRLFGNIFAGEVLLAVIGFLVPVILPMPFYGMELFVGLIQALVFALLSLVFFNMATLGHEGN
jgi:F-type H+-transporting ATPase subunit a